MSSLVLRDLLKHKIRKEILKNNKKINHKSYVKAMQFGQKIPYLMKYHKKKLVFFLVLGIITWNYSLHKSLYYWLLTMRPPHKILLGLIVDMEQPQPTVTEMNSIIKIQLTEDTKDILIKLYYEADKYLYFGVGRKYLYHVYKDLGLLQTQEQEKNVLAKVLVLQKSKSIIRQIQRNQLAAGVSLVEHLSLFQEALKKQRQKNSQLTEEQFRNKFVNLFIDKASQIMKWQAQFNSEREKQFLKNAPGLSESKKQMISDILKENPEISIYDLQEKLKNIGLKGMNLSDRYYYHRTQQVWYNMKQLNLLKRLSHPTIHMDLGLKQQLERQLRINKQKIEKINSMKEKDLEEYQKLYQKELL